VGVSGIQSINLTRCHPSLAWFLDAIEDVEVTVEVIEEDSVDGPGAPFVVEDEVEEVHQTVRHQLEEMMAPTLKSALKMFVFPTK
jgi:hypothetical protein